MLQTIIEIRPTDHYLFDVTTVTVEVVEPAKKGKHVFTAADREKAAATRAYNKVHGKPEKPAPKERHQFTEAERRLGGVRGFAVTSQLYPLWLEKKIRGWSTNQSRARNIAYHLSADARY